MARPRPTIQALHTGILSGDRAMLARAITLVESKKPAHQEQARALLAGLMPHTGGAHRVGITGVPGVGKSTFVEAMGLDLLKAGRRVAVLAVDPSSTRTGGSILGDKTRMELLSRDTRAFIRPSPTGGTLGGVASRTREALLLCEAAGYDVVLIETVGVGQSELAVAQMSDVFLVLMLAGAGDGLQGIKRGLMELADVLAVNKADGENEHAAARAAQTYRDALRTLHPRPGGWVPAVRTCSALKGQGVSEIWEILRQHQQEQQASGAWDARRAHQQQRWMWAMVDEGLRSALRQSEAVRALLPELEAQVQSGAVAPTHAAQAVLRRFLKRSPQGESAQGDPTLP